MWRCHCKRSSLALGRQTRPLQEVLTGIWLTDEVIALLPPRTSDRGDTDGRLDRRYERSPAT